ncbi:NAD(P)/FAD-dependent oxidoreductase [Actinokineospora auranticolor]|uniref:Cation diffusion facilitator CzcD-associated flavoprotein CzcO n=1 Tax=Actinokineospora auranticolor TaxID=155976 RepID=A0A2S6GFI6_9PSEU|nr:NAD(P)/FAD-dependent oxidoreductase [Actinokineospora auranticolor]PPK63941.1 cation diffusion facilitator CzcD-associated flavoprotein CzcO [Actinokineospora auranticolor]
MPHEHVDVLVIGAGLSGVAAACHLRTRVPDASVAVLEARSAIGGTWDLFRYPGVRSDSDMYTLGYSFRPWPGASAIADGTSIREYIVDTAREYGVDRLVRFDHRVTAAEWNSATGRWTVTAAHGSETVRMTCGFLFSCAGFFGYEHGHTPEFAGRDRFGGTVAHPQRWPEDLDWTGKRVAVIGSGATAVTLVPALAERAAHVVMVQRSPSYVVSLSSRDPVAGLLRRVLPGRVAHPVLRWKNALFALSFFTLARRRPALVRKLIRWGARRQLPADYPVDTHFRPDYDPWTQRVCFAADGDLFRVLRTGRAEVVTDRVESFTERGLALASGGHVDADIVVTATGLHVVPFGGVAITVDGVEVDYSDTVTYKGMLLGGVPNLAVAMGYTNASWTLKIDLVAQYVCRLIIHMRERGLSRVTPRPPEGQATEPFVDFTSTYVRRTVHLMPRQGEAPPWRLYQNYPRDVALLRHGRIEDPDLVFG